jgi:hypothetical protein
MLLTEAKYWIVQRGIGHVVVEAEGMIAWSVTKTACGLSIQNHWPSKDRPCRVCRKCREAVKDFVLCE